MAAKHTLVIACLVFLIFFLLGAAGLPARALMTAVEATPAAQPTLIPAGLNADPTEENSDTAIHQAFQAAVEQKRQAVIGLLLYDPVIINIQYANDGRTALTWVGLRDPQTGEIVAEEPGLSIAQSEPSKPVSDPGSWAITFQPEPAFSDLLKNLPEELLTEEIRARFLDGADAEPAVPARVLTGYKLPWAAGLAKRVTNSIGHVISVSGGLTSCPTSCRYAYDFADGTMFSLLAAKGGTVKAYRTSCPNNQKECTNYLVLEDQSTTPVTYQLYYHMAQESIPPHLRTAGTVVSQGEYIGTADNTGFSTGSHLHYHVFTSATAGNWSWGNSVDFTFDDVTDNGGRPRTCAEAREHPEYGGQCMAKNLYTSGNTPAHPPSGTIDLPSGRDMVSSRTVWMQGLAEDDIAIARIQVMVNYDGTWRGIDDITPASPYGKDVDLCAAGVPDGPFKLTLRIFDREGSQAAGLPVLQMIKSFACGLPAAQKPPEVRITYPVSRMVPPDPFKITVAAADAAGEPVSKVDFFYHGPNWDTPWVSLGADTNGTDGWSMPVTPATYGSISGSALYVQVHDRAGGVKGAALWDLEPDYNTPTSQLNGLPAQSTSTVMELSWSVFDYGDNLDHFELQYQEYSPDGSPVGGPVFRQIPAHLRRALVAGKSGSTYHFRMRAVSRAGASEPYPDQPETSTTIATTCTPDTNESKGTSPFTAIPLANGQAGPILNLCKSSLVPAGDIDWVTIKARANEPLMIIISSEHGGAAFSANLYQGLTLAASWKSTDLGTGIIQVIPASDETTYMLEIRPLTPEMYGTDMQYQVWYGTSHEIYMPLMSN